MDYVLNKKQLGWAEHMLKLAKLISERSPCVRRKVGCVITNNKNRMIACGYNGNIPGHPHCTKETCYRTVNNIPSGEQLDRCESVHGEMNAVISAAIQGVSLVDSYVYVTTMPCITCMKLLLSIQPKMICFESSYNYDSISWIMEHEKNCDIIKVTTENDKIVDCTLLNPNKLHPSSAWYGIDPSQY